MSFILDALKKSESERHRHSGPVLMDVRIAPPRRRLPVWAWVIAGVLLVNALLLLWVLWLAPDHHAAAPASAVVAPTPAPQIAAPPAVVATTAPPTPAPQNAAPVVGAAPLPETLPPSTTAVPQLPAASTPPPANAPVIDTANLPRVQDLIAAGAGLPELRLSLHVFDAVPANRYVLLNGMRLREGEFTPEGVKVLQIAPTGVVLEWRGRRMFLSAAG
jgi:general secretion pathway protein B